MEKQSEVLAKERLEDIIEVYRRKLGKRLRVRVREGIEKAVDML